MKSRYNKELSVYANGERQLVNYNDKTRWSYSVMIFTFYIVNRKKIEIINESSKAVNMLD